jgi:adenosylmethionine-8-amino-7-oxononanoate aminotransferase
LGRRNVFVWRLQMCEIQLGLSSAKATDLVDKIPELRPERVACFIAEPVLASGGLIVPPTGISATPC